MSYKEAQTGKALFYVHIEGREAEANNKGTKLMFDALSLVMEDPSTNWANRALLLGVDMEDQPLASIQEYLLDVAKNKPNNILRVYRDKSMKINLLFMKAKKKNVISVNPQDNVIKFGGTILGVTDDSAIAFLQENEDILELVERAVNPDYYQSKQEKRTLSVEERLEAARQAKQTKAE